MAKKQIVTASQIGQYVFCAKAWDMQRSGVGVSVKGQSQMKQGTKAHVSLNRGLNFSYGMRIIGAGFILLGLLVALLKTIFS